MAANYGAEAEYVPPVDLSPQVRCTMQLERTQTAARRVRQEIDALQQAADFHNKESAVFMKFDYLQGEMHVYQEFLAIVTTHRTLLERDAVVVTAAQLRVHDRFYQQLEKALCHMEAGFKRVLDYDNRWYREQVRIAKNLIQQHPAKFAALFSGLPASLGAVAYGGRVQYGFCLLTRLLALTSEYSACAASVSMTTTILTGVGVGLVASLLVYGAVKYFLPKEYESDRLEQARRNEVNRMVEKLREVRSEDLLEGMTSFANRCGTTFCQPTFIPEDICLVCHDTFDANDNTAGRRPVRSTTCRGKHFMHHECWQAWIAQRPGSIACPSCGA